jgi:hypothetical protein
VGDKVQFVRSEKMRNPTLKQMKGKFGEVTKFALITERLGYCRVSIKWDEGTMIMKIKVPRTWLKLII